MQVDVSMDSPVGSPPNITTWMIKEMQNGTLSPLDSLKLSAGRHHRANPVLV